MKSYLSLSWKELKAQKVTSVLILIAVILSTMATTALGQSIGILQSMRIEQASGLNGDRFATFHQITGEQKESLESDPRLKDVGSIINLGHVELGNSGLTLFLREYQGNALDAYPSVGKLKEGRLPAGKGEIALSEDAMQYLGFDGGPGDVITLPVSISQMRDTELPYEYTADFVLTGILEDNYIGYATGTVDAVVGEGSAKELLPERYFLYSTDFKTKNTKHFQEIVDDLAEKLAVPEDDIQYNWMLLEAMGIDFTGKESTIDAAGFPFMMAACVMVGALLLLAAGLVIYNILKVAVAKRIREYGTLRAIGSGQGQLYGLVTLQILILCGIGLPLGMLCGALSAKGILTAAVGMFNPDIFLAESTQELNNAIAGAGTGGAFPLLASALVTCLFAVLAAYPSARYAARVSPTVAMSGQTVLDVSKPMGSLDVPSGAKEKKIRNFEAFYARLNLRRNRSRTAITVLSMVMSITVFVALQSFSGLMDTSRRMKDMHLGDYAVTNETVGISPEAVSRMREQELVEKLSTSKLTVYSQDQEGHLPVDLDVTLQPAETFQIAAVDVERLADFAPGLSEEDRRDVENGTACLVKNPFQIAIEGLEVEYTEFQENDRITVNGTSLRVAGVTENLVSINNEGFVNGVQVIVSDALYDRLTGDDRYSEIYPALAEDVDPEAFEEWLDGWCDENPGSHWLSYRQSDAQLEESYEQIRMLCWGLILFIGLIGILNIINTVYTNIHTRIGEIGMQRAIGMSVPSLYKTFLWEGAYYGLGASVIGAVCGYVCTVFVEAAATDSLALVPVPVVPIMEAAVVSVLACLAATAVPLRAIGKMNIVESIGNVE